MTDARDRRGARLFTGTALALFVILNLAGSSLALVAAGVLVALVAAGSLWAAPPGSVAGVPRRVPFVFFCTGALLFSADWARQPFTHWVQWGVTETSVAIGLCLLALGLVAALVGTRVGDWLARALPPGRAWWPERSSWLICAALACLTLGWLSRAWAWQQGLVGFWVDAFGVDFSAHSGPFVTFILAVRSFVDIGQAALCLLVLRASPAERAWTETRRGRILLGMVLLVSLAADLVLRLQSGSRGTFFSAFLPLLVIANVNGYGRWVRRVVTVGCVIYAVVLFSFFTDMRSLVGYRTDVETGRVYVPSLTGTLNPAETHLDRMEAAFARLNQASLFGAAVEAERRGKSPLLGSNYVAGFETLVPRILAPGRRDELTSYDEHAGIPGGVDFYNDWGVIAEGFVNFRVAGVVLLPFIAGAMWQLVFIRFLVHGPSFGLCLGAALWLPSVWRCGEYAFLPGILSPLKIMLGLTVLLLALTVLVGGGRAVLGARRP